MCAGAADMLRLDAIADYAASGGTLKILDVMSGTGALCGRGSW